MTEQVGYFQLLRGNHDFRNLFLGRLISLLGDWFNILAILAMLRAFGDESAMGFAGVLILKTLPAVFSPLAGVLADRLPRRGLMVAADLGRAAVVLGMVSLAWFPSVVALYVLVAIQSLLSGVFEPARNALLPDLVEPEELTAANAISAASWSLMLAVGSALGGLFADFAGWRAALLFDAGTYIVSVLFLLQVREPVREITTRVGAGGVLTWLGVRDLVEGAAWMARRPRVWTLALVKPLWQVAGARTLVLTLLGETAFAIAGWPLLAVSVLWVARGIGTGLGPFLARWATRSDPVAMERALLISFVGTALGYVFLGLAPALWMAAIMLIVAHLGGATIWVFSTVRLQQIVPTAVRGRVFAAEHAGFVLMVAASNGVFGQLADELSRATSTWLPPLEAALGPEGAVARALAITLGLITAVPLLFWVIRGAWLGWGGPPEDVSGLGET